MVFRLLGIIITIVVFAGPAIATANYLLVKAAELVSTLTPR